LTTAPTGGGNHGGQPDLQLYERWSSHSHRSVACSSASPAKKEAKASAGKRTSCQSTRDGLSQETKTGTKARRTGLRYLIQTFKSWEIKL